MYLASFTDEEGTLYTGYELQCRDTLEADADNMDPPWAVGQITRGLCADCKGGHKRKVRIKVWHTKTKKDDKGDGNPSDLKKGKSKTVAVDRNIAKSIEKENNSRSQTTSMTK